MASNNWVAGGELGGIDKTPQDFKQIILDILQEGESVTRALKRLKPPPKRTANKRKTRSSVKKDEDKGDTEDPDERAEHDKQFNLLTEAAGELMSLGFEDIYQDNKEDIAANMQKGADQGVSRGGVVWHDDGTVKDAAPTEHSMYQRSTDNAALNYQESAQAASLHQVESAAMSQQMHIPTPSSALISEDSQAAPRAAPAAGTAEADGAADAEPDMADQATVTPAVQTHMDSEVVSEPADNTVPPELHASTALPSQDITHSQAGSAAALVSDSLTPMPGSSSEAAAAAEHITQAAELGTEDHAVAAVDPAKESVAGQPPAETDSAQEAAQDSDHKAAAANSEASVPDGSIDTALNSSAAAQQQDGPVSTASGTAGVAGAQQGVWQGKAKGPGLGESTEFSGGPMNFERPKYRHSPYGPPPVRPGGRYASDMGRNSPRGRSSPTGRSFGRGFSEPYRSSIMRPQYSQQPPSHMAHGGFPPHQYGGGPLQPPPPQYQQQAPYYVPQQPYPPPPQQGYPQYPGQQPYAPTQQQYPPQQYAQPPQYDAQAPQYDSQWQQHQQYGAYPQPAAYPPAAAPPPEQQS